MNNERQLDTVGYQPHGHKPLRLSDFHRRRPVTVYPDSSIGTALRIMEENRIGSVIVIDPDSGRPLGIFTLRDVLCRIAIPGVDIAQPIAKVMTRNPVSVPGTLSVPQAAQEMARLELRHLLVTGIDGALTGIVSRTDIYHWMCDSCATLRRAKTARAEHCPPVRADAEFFAAMPSDSGLN